MMIKLKNILTEAEVSKELWYHVTNDIVPPDYMDFNTMEGINDFKDIIETFGIEISDESGLQGTFH